MVDKTQIKKILKRLNKTYSSSRISNERAKLCSKLAISEFCGWIEMSFDTIAKDYLQKHNFQHTKTVGIVEDFIDGIYSFKYEKLFYIISITIGSVQYDKILRKLDSSGNLDVFKDILKKYEKPRNRLSHTYSTNVTQTYQAPSVVLLDFYKMLNIVLIIEKEVQQIKV